MAFLDRWLRRDGIDDDEYGYDEPMEQEVFEPEPQAVSQPARRQSNRVVDFKTGAKPVQQEVVLVAPTDFGMTWQICDYVRDGKTVICNIESVPADYRQRFVDFINGASYALGGVIRPISKLIFVFAPKSTTVSVPEAVQQAEEREPFEREHAFDAQRGVRSSAAYMRQPRAFQTNYQG